MPADLPYMPSVVNVAAILDKIRSAGTPPKFTYDFLKASLGFGSSNDRAMIKILRNLGFISADSTPTQRYNDYKGAQAGRALALGLRDGWAELFLADQKVFERTVSQVQAIVKSATGAGDAVAMKTASTFKALSDKADWSVGAPPSDIPPGDAPVDQQRQRDEGTHDDFQAGGLLRLHHDIHLHLPPTSEVSVYRAIFQALKAELM
jgi:hypothetical protein